VPPPTIAPPRERELGARALATGVAALVAAEAAFLAVRLTAWPPHEDEALALVVGSRSLPDLLGTVLGERGGAPFHFLLAWIVAHLGGSFTELRLVSALLALAALPLVALLAARLAGRTVALVAVALVSGSWMLLFHGVYGRMYSLFLVTSLLSYLALGTVLGEGGRRRWALWVAATLLTLAAHPYGALVLASQGLYVLLARERVREALAAAGALLVLATPLWYADLVLAGRFDVGVGGGGERLGGPLGVLGYLARVAGDFSVGWPPALALVLVAAAGGLRLLARRNGPGALLIGAVFMTPALALFAARLGGTTSPETRHLIFALPFFATLVATALVWTAKRLRPEPALAVLLTSALFAGEIAWAAARTPLLFTGDPPAHAEGRGAAAAWLAETGRPNDVLLGYEPVFLEAWKRGGRLSRRILPRADARLAAEELRRAPLPLGRGVWLFDAYDTNNLVQRLSTPVHRPRPAGEYEARAFGPVLVVRTRLPVRTPERYLRAAAAALIAGYWLDNGDADVNFATVDGAARRLGYGVRASTSSRSTASR